MRTRLILSLLLLVAMIPAGRSQVVSTQFGPVEGTRIGSVHQFLGIPFARPPIGSLRWKAPQDPELHMDTLNATDYAPACPQKRYEQGSTEYTFEGSEDCLYLNIWTPQTLSSTLPVLVFIHGGGNQQGSAGEMQGGTRLYFGGNMAERGDAVIVTIQYRLGPLGFLVHPGLEQENSRGISGNYAVLDQILALKWIRNNIAAFGGDPLKVMIFGESAGGVNVGNLIFSPLASGLFHRACIQSASPALNDYLDSKIKGMWFVDSLIPDGSDEQKISQLRELPADSLIRSLPSPIIGGKIQMNWQPVVDQYVFPDFPIRSLQEGRFNEVPLLIGSNSEEMSLSAPLTVIPAMVAALINASVPAALRPEALALYPPGNTSAEARESYVGILTDAQFTVNNRRTAQCVEKNQSEPVWRYFFTHKHTIPLLAGLGSYHGMELFYVFNTWENTSLGSGLLFKPQDDSVQQAMLRYWVNFANTGNPNSPGLMNWPEYHADTDTYLEIKATPDGSKAGVRRAECDFWDRLAGFQGCTGTESAAVLKYLPEYRIYPNPTQGEISILTPESDEEGTFLLFDLYGRKLAEGQTRDNPDLSGFASGAYVLLIRHREQALRFFVIRQ